MTMTMKWSTVAAVVLGGLGLSLLVPTQAGAAAPAAEPLFTCAVDVSPPSGGGAPDSPVSAEASAVCLGLGIEGMRLMLYRDGALVASDELFFPTAAPRAAIRVSTPDCVPGTYQASALVTVRPPRPPAPARILANGPQALIDCG